MTVAAPLLAPVEAFPPAKRAILTASLKLFASRGVDGVSVRDIAAATGFSNPALFRHFASKDDLARTLFEACYRRLADALHAASALGGLQAWLHAALAEIEAGPEGVHFVLENVRRYWPDLPGDLRGRNLPTLTRGMLEAEQAAGRVGPDLDTSMAAIVVLGTLGQIARSAHFREADLRPSAMAETLAMLLLRGFSVQRSPSPS